MWCLAARFSDDLTVQSECLDSMTLKVSSNKNNSVISETVQNLLLVSAEDLYSQREYNS